MVQRSLLIFLASLQLLSLGCASSVYRFGRDRSVDFDGNAVRVGPLDELADNLIQCSGVMNTPWLIESSEWCSLHGGGSVALVKNRNRRRRRLLHWEFWMKFHFLRFLYYGWLGGPSAR